MPHAIVATVALAGLRTGELRAIERDDFTGEVLNVRQAAWRQHVGLPKTETSKGLVPVIAPLRSILETYLSWSGITSGKMFPGARAECISLDSVTRHYGKPICERLGFPWLGWHGFRRACSSIIIGELKVRPELAQRILRHKDMATTLRLYTKIQWEDAIGDLGTFEKAFTEVAVCNNWSVYATAESE
jgi:integrase